MRGADTWITKIRNAEQLGQETMELINDRNHDQRTGSSSSKVSSSIRLNLQKLSQLIQDLRDDLMKSSTSHTITPKEAERRQYQIDQLISKERQLNQAMKPKDYGYQSFDRSGLLNDGFDSSPFPSARSGPDVGDMSYSDMRAKQQQLIEEQDQGLDALVDVIQRQKMMGRNIGDEVDYQNDLIDEIADHVDATETRLIQENKHVKKVTKKTGSCALFVVIVLLLLAIVVIAVLPKSVT